jgi:hypothetical protein
MTIATVQTQVAGYFKIEAVKPDGTRRVLADWFPNLILDQGLDRMGANSDYLNACQVGTGNTAPAVGQTGLVSYTAGTSTTNSTTTGAAADAPYYGWRRNVFRFAAGAAEGNLSEVGVGWSTSGSDLFSRALILDGLGDPTTITVLSDEFLDVTYELRQYAPTADVTGTVVDGSDSYDFTLRAARATVSTHWGGGLGIASSHQIGQVPFFIAYTGTLGAVTGQPSGTTASISSSGQGVNAAYSASSYQRDFTVSAGLSDINLSGGVRSVLIPTTRGEYQCEFDPPIPKDGTKTLVLGFRVTWARRT